MKIIFSIFLFFSQVFLCHGQTLSEPRTVENNLDPIKIILNGSEILEEVQSGGSENQIFIEQTGNSNLVNSVLLTTKNDLEILQFGSYNSAVINANARRIEGQITQNGNSNYSFAFSHDPTQEVNLRLIQNGNNHHFERHGSNSIGNSLKFEMTGDSKTIIVRNFQ